MCSVLRCKVAECDDYSQPPIWIPSDAKKCEMYDRVSDFHRHSVNLKNCSAETFNTSSIVKCSDFVFETKEVNILNEVCVCHLLLS